MGRGRAKRRPPTPSDSSSSEEDEEDEDEADDESENEEEEEEELMLLPVGAEVEVRSDDPGFAGSFYEATVAGHLLSGGRRGRYTVAYSTLLVDDGDEPLRETAAAANVRPRPPPQPEEREFAVHEMVEAFHNDGWWAGVVSAVNPQPVVAGDHRQTRVYRVTFPTSREMLEFQEADLRPHRVFVGGRWVPAAEVDNGSPLFGEGNQVEVSGKYFGASWSPATVLKVIGATQFLVQYMHIENEGELATEIVDSQDIRPARAITRMNSKYRFSAASHVEVHHEGSWWPGVIVEVLGSGINKKYVVKLKNHKTDMEGVEPADVLTVENTQLRPRFDWDGKKWVRCLKELSYQNYVREMHPFQQPSNGPQLTSRRRLVSALYDDSDKLSNEPDSRRDKKLKNAVVISEQISSQGNVVGLASNGNQNLYTSVDCPFSATSLAALEDDLIITGSTTKFSGSSQSIEKSTVTPFSSVGMSNYSVTEPDDSLAITNGVEGTPVSRYVTGRTHDSCSPLSREPVAVHECTMDTDGRLSESLAIQHLPFQKTSPMWAQIEALEIFRKVPQQPHFHQSEQYSPELREGMALGLMLSFTHLTESINMLDVQGDKGLLEQKMKGLALLEENGFDVTYLRSRVETLLTTNNSCVDLRKMLEDKIAHKKTEDRELGAQVCKLAMAVHHLELNAYLMRNMMRSAITQKMSNAMKISRLKAEANDLERSYLSNAAPRSVCSMHGGTLVNR